MIKMNRILEGKIALVTGASRGIGRAISLDLARNGAYIGIVYNQSKSEAERLKSEIDAYDVESILIKANLSIESEVLQMVSVVAKKWSHIDILVNCAGIMRDNLVENMPLVEWNEVINTNLQGVFLTCKAAIPFLKKSKSGSIINISSQAGYRGSVRHAHYAAAKSGLIGFTFSLARELGEFDITANIVSPGRIRTDMIEERITDDVHSRWMQETPLKRYGEPDEVAYLVSFLASEKGRYITGANININGGMFMA